MMQYNFSAVKWGANRATFQSTSAYQHVGPVCFGHFGLLSKFLRECKNDVSIIFLLKNKGIIPPSTPGRCFAIESKVRSWKPKREINTLERNRHIFK